MNRREKAYQEKHVREGICYPENDGHCHVCGVVASEEYFFYFYGRWPTEEEKNAPPFAPWPVDKGD